MFFSKFFSRKSHKEEVFKIKNEIDLKNKNMSLVLDSIKNSKHNLITTLIQQKINADQESLDFIQLLDTSIEHSKKIRNMFSQIVLDSNKMNECINILINTISNSKKDDTSIGSYKETIELSKIIDLFKNEVEISIFRIKELKSVSNVPVDFLEEKYNDFNSLVNENQLKKIDNKSYFLKLLKEIRNKMLIILSYYLDEISFMEGISSSENAKKISFLKKFEEDAISQLNKNGISFNP